MIAGIVALLVLFGFSAGDNLKILDKTVKKEVQGKERSERARDCVARMRSAIEKRQAEVDRIRAEVVALDQNYDATAQDYRKLFDELTSAWKALQKDLLDARFALRDTLSEEEWNRVFAKLEKKS